ncbi:MAG: hypothetical protein WCD70_17170 [Alphaproteobacteria bacterium]
MTSHSDKFGLNGLVNGELIKLSRARPIEGEAGFHPGEFELAGAKLELLSRITRQTEATRATINRVLDMDSQESALNNFKHNRHELVVLPLTGMLDQINNHYADHMGSPEKTAEWNRRIHDLLITTFGDFSDYLIGMKWSRARREWIVIDPPRPEQATKVASDLIALVRDITEGNFSRHLNEDNLRRAAELFGHLQPHIEQDFRQQGYGHK